MRIGSLTLKKDDVGFWTGTLKLPSWQKAFGAKRSKILIEIDSEDEPSDTRVRGLKWLIDHEAAALKSVLRAIERELPRFRKTYGFGEIAKLEKVIEPTSVGVHEVKRGTAPSIGYSFRCPWDEEHGLGVLMHGVRAVQVGGADVAILEWIAEKDAKKK